MAAHQMNHVRAKKIFITGLPGVGKTTLVLKIAEALRDTKPVGFYTTEIRERGARQGFEMRSFSGEKGILSHIDIRSRYRVGKYGVDVEGFEKFLRAIPFFQEEGGIIIIDEIGKMECLSAEFRKLVGEILESDWILIATVALKGEGLIRQVKERRDILLSTLRPDNRDQLLGEILRTISPGD
jgi:nucleoside-triphosphatase